MLAFVLVQTLNLDIENRLRVDVDTGTPLHELSETHFIRLLNVTINLTEFGIVGVLLQLDQLVEIVGPLFLQRLIEQGSERRITLFNPATRRNAVGHVMEFVRPQLVIFREQILHHQIGVQRRDAVHRKAAHHAHVGHANLFIMDHRQLRPHLLIARPGFLHQQFKSVVNLFDYLHVARQQRLHQLLIPALQRFRHQSMVGVSEGFAGDGPRIVPAHLVLIKQHAQQFRDGDGRVGVVQLDHFIIRQLMQLAASQMVATQNVRHRAGALEVLLHQAQFFPRQMVVIRIQHLGQFFGVDTLLLRAQEIAVVEFGQVERMGMFRLPQAQRLRDVIAIAKHR